jgi:hypothetical protein
LVFWSISADFSSDFTGDRHDYYSFPKAQSYMEAVIAKYKNQLVMQATGWACWSSYNKHVGSVMFM